MTKTPAHPRANDHRLVRVTDRGHPGSANKLRATHRLITTRPVRPILAAAALLMPFIGGGASLADRHCSFARESAFYARELAREAGQAPTKQCTLTIAAASERLRDTAAQLKICSCAPAEGPLDRWLASQPEHPPAAAAACVTRADDIAAIAQVVLVEVEKCF